VGMWVVTLFPAVIANDPSLSWDKLNRGEIRYARSEGFAKALRQFKRLFDEGLVNPDFLSTSYEKGQEIMATGKAGMYLSGSYFAADTTKKFAGSELMMFPAPTVSRPVFASADIQSFNVFVKAGNVDRARRLIDFLAEPAQQKRIDQDWSAIPAFKDVTIELPPYLQSVVDNYIRKGNPPVMAMGSASIVDIAPLVDLTVEMIAGKITPEKVLADWDKKLEEISKERKLPGWN
jgi:ABC-type glycerol-3-phosphate transport system substrate-binding protein